LLYMLFLKGKKEFSSCSLHEICKFLFTENKANAHAGMPFGGISQFVVSASWLILATALSGRGSFAFVGKRQCRASCR
ncbi:MAG: hypothetical protein IJT13_04295, partial [Bacteroidaceae bacterium]|nr:hypothetical protein [Bacteroidaceae bacterium]